MSPRCATEPRRKTFLMFALIALCSLLSLSTDAQSAEIPVVGLASGDESRAQIIEQLNHLGGFTFETPGMTVLTPGETARKVEKVALRRRRIVNPQSQLEEIDLLTLEAWKGLEAGDHMLALSNLELALGMLEYDESRIRPGEEERWFLTRILKAATHMQDPRTPGGDLKAARDTMRPLCIFFPDTKPSELGHGRLLDEMYDALVRDLYLRPRGRLSIDTFGVEYEVFINGVFVGYSPIEDFVLPVGEYTVEAGHSSSPSRVHHVSIPRGGDEHLSLDPAFEQNLSTQGFVLYEAPGETPTEVLTTYVGRGIGQLLDARYVLVLGKSSGDDDNGVHMALVDAKNGVIVKEGNVKMDGLHDEQAMADELEFMLERRDPKEAGAWPFERWAWIGSSIAGVIFTGVGIYYFSDGIDSSNQADDTLVGSTQNQQLHDDANESFLLGGISLGVGFTFFAIATYYLYADLHSDQALYGGTVDAGDLRFLAAPTVDANGAMGWSLGATWNF